MEPSSNGMAVQFNIAPASLISVLPPIMSTLSILQITFLLLNSMRRSVREVGTNLDIIHKK
jgi:hypothetical protein